VLQEPHDTEELIERIAALDIGKAELTCCVRVPSSTVPDKRSQEVTTYKTMTRSLLQLADRLAELGVTRVVMEATSDSWKSPFYLLEGHGFETWLVNAKTSSTCRGGLRPTGWMRCGSVRSPNGSCCGQALCRHR
jgi:transposase